MAAVGAGLDVVEPRDQREVHLGAGERVERLQVGRLVVGDDPAVGRADDVAAAERGGRQADLEGRAGGGAVDRRGVVVVVGAGAGVEEAGRWGGERGGSRSRRRATRRRQRRRGGGPGCPAPTSR